MKKFVVLCVGLGLAASTLIYIAGRTVSQTTYFHYFGVPAVKVPHIKLEVMYVVPGDQDVDPRFREVLASALSDVQRFHLREFANLSSLRSVLYPSPIRGWEPSSFYDGSDTGSGNPGAIRRIFNETAARVYNPDGDLYDAAFVKRKDNELPVRVFVYEGVGASSGVLSAIVSYDYFTKTDYGATTLYHEVLHNIGVPDAYDYFTGVSHADDIMGAGRTRPILETYVREEIKRKLTE
jgi:hypothetical protein